MRKPSRVIIVRHAESQEDVDPNLNGLKEDSQINLTDKGVGQALDVASEISRRLSGVKSIKIFRSNSNRAVQTTNIIGSGLTKLVTDINTDHRIRSLDWGETTPDNVEQIKKERYDAGVLYYKFPKGDDSAVFVERIGEFVDEVLNTETPSGTVLIVTHGFAMRIIAKFLLKMSDKEFRWISNPPNCYIAEFTINESGYATIDKPMLKRKPI